MLAKAPVAGRVKTRLGADVGMAYAADLAAAALLDTLLACTAAFGPGSCRLALAGDLTGAVRADELHAALGGWTVVPQRGGDFAERLVNAHLDAAEHDGAVVQIGMDTPQVTTGQLTAVADGLAHHGAVLGHGPRRRLVGARAAPPGRRGRPARRTHVHADDRPRHARRAGRRRAQRGGGGPAPRRRHGRGRSCGGRRRPARALRGRLGGPPGGGGRDAVDPARSAPVGPSRGRLRPGDARALRRADPRRRLRAGSDERPPRRAGPGRARGGPRARRGGQGPRARRPGAAPRRLRPDARRGTVGDRAARRRQHRHRRQPARAAAAHGRRDRRRRPHRHRPGTSRRGRPGRVGAPGGRRGSPARPSAGPGSPSTRWRRWRCTPGWSSPRSTTTTAAGSRSWRRRRDARAGRDHLHLPAAQPGGRRPRRTVARHLLRRRLPDRAGQPLRPGTRPAGPVPYEARRGPTGSPRGCT